MQTPPTISFQKYLLYAIYLVRTSPTLLGILLLLGILDGVLSLLPEGTLNYALTALTVVASFFIRPVGYAFFYERIEKKSSSARELFKTYIPGYILLLFCIYIPIAIMTGSVSQTGEDLPNMAYIVISMLFFSMLLLYVVPCYFVTGKIGNSIAYGITFLLSNIFNSAPLLLMALFSAILLIVTQYQFSWLLKTSPQLFALLEVIIYLLASIVDFLLFIILVYILREQQDLPKRPNKQQGTTNR